MMSSREYQPLISTDFQYDYTYESVPKSSGRSYKKLGGLLLVFALLTVAAIAVYVLQPWHSFHGAGLVHHHNKLRRTQMEASHPAIVPKRWTEGDACSDDNTFTMTFAIKEENMDMLDEWVMAVSDPKSPTFHQYWTAQQIQETFAPSQETLDTVKSWLEPHGFSEENGNLRYRATHGNLLQVDITCAVANEMLGAKYLVYEETDTGRQHLRVQDGIYSVPARVADLIDWIEPTIRFPIKSHTKETVALTDITREDFAFPADVKFEGYNTPPRLYTLYGLDDSVLDDDLLTLVDDTGMSQAIVSYDAEYYTDSDLELAWDTIGYAYDNDIDQMVRCPTNQSEGYGAEAELDTQYMTSTGLGLTTYVYYINGNNDDYFSAIVEDALESDDPPAVISISYGADEYEWGVDYCSRANEAFGKLALLGTTVFASSGDDGALGDDDDCVDDYMYIASFPASATYVTAVGGTVGGSETSLDANGTTEEVAWSYSGGGFSLFFDRPGYQDQAVTNYFDQDISYPRKGQYNADGKGIPDISAQSVEYIIAYDDAFYTVSGTSCSSPTVAGMFAMVNVKRENNEKAKLGFLNPALYAMYNAQGDDYNIYFNDVTAGYNLGCSDDDDIAFFAGAGWDPITGCGTPKFQDILNFMAEILD